MNFQNPQRVDIYRGRWDITIQVIDADGQEHQFIASADSAFAEGSGIWFGTRDEYDEKEMNL